ncbi:hypothetical protein HDU98_002261 [Podochytrium sp. JEL0797]|nr:hypothetical protein HDU98_002261 [Podochytrium sp. JEL0797]
MKTSFLYTLATLHLANAASHSLLDVLAASGETTNLLSLINSSPATLTALSNFSGTFFAPTDAALAFSTLNLTNPTQLLAYHTVPTAQFAAANFVGTDFLATLEGNDVKIVEGEDSSVLVFSAFGNPPATVIKSIYFDTGYLHIINKALVPPANVVDVAKAANLTVLVDAIVAAGLADTVSKLTNVTILAPTNEAFARVAAGLSVAQLQQVLLYHVIPGVAHSTDIVKAKSLPAVPTANNGTTLDIEFNGTNVLITGKGNNGPATVVLADVLADRVVVHVIDTVLSPPLVGAATTTAAGVVSKSGGFAALAVIALFV